MLTASPRRSLGLVSSVLVALLASTAACASRVAPKLVAPTQAPTDTVASAAPKTTPSRMAVLAPGQKGPAYPDSLVRARTEGSVLVQFVLDSTGYAMLPSLRVLKSDHPLLTAAVRDGLSGMRFLPAEVNGRTVRQLGQQRFDFRTNGERGHTVVISPLSMPSTQR